MREPSPEVSHLTSEAYNVLKKSKAEETHAPRPRPPTNWTLKTYPRYLTRITRLGLTRDRSCDHLGLRTKALDFLSSLGSKSETEGHNLPSSVFPVGSLPPAPSAQRTEVAEGSSNVLTGDFDLELQAKGIHDWTTL